MPATVTDRLRGLTTSVAIKPPCKAVSTASITLSGEQTVGGVECIAGDRVLMAITGGSVSNGIWVVDTGAWSRAADFDGARDVVFGTTILVLDSAANIGFWVVTTDADIVPGATVIELKPAGGDPTTLLLDLASPLATKGPDLVGYDGSDATQADYAENTVGWAVNILRFNDVRLIERIPRAEWAAISAGTSTYDASAKVLEIIADSPGRAIILPAGKIRIDNSVARITTSTSAYTEGLKLIGPGSSLCEIDTRVAGYAIKIDTNAVSPTARFQRNCILAGFKISGATGNPLTATGVYLRHAYNVLMEDVSLEDLTQDGVIIDVQEGDPDGCNSVIFRRSRVLRAGRWGIQVQSAPGTNECSYFQMIDGSSVTDCGTGYAFDAAANVAPTSGGVKWKGNAATFRDSYINQCRNVGLFIEGGAGLGLLFAMRGFTFENNGWNTSGGASTGAQVYCSGVRGGTFTDIDMRNNDSYRAAYGFMFEATDWVSAGINIDRVQIQATTGNNPYTLYQARGTNGLDASVGATDYRLFDGTGQTRFGSGMYSAWQSPRYDDGGKATFQPNSAVETTLTSAGPSYAPDVARYTTHSVILGAGASGTLSLSAFSTSSLPSAALVGREVNLIIYNNSGGSMSLTAAFATRSMPTSLANGATTAARFVYRSATNTWSQVGAWG